VPKETFYNLPDKKRQLIVGSAISEFAAFGYDKASITRIVNKCGIAKGSFYQYFEDKKDLYFYLVTKVSEEKVRALEPVMQKRGQYDFFTLIRELFLEGLKFAARNPQITLMGDWLFKNKGHPIYNEIVGVGLQSAQNIYTEILEEAIKKGQVRDDIDPGFISHSISSLSVSAVEYYFQAREEKKARVRKFDEGMIDTIDLLIDFLKNGIGTKGKGRQQ
jgi:AcrR family transcriptional regulator